MENKTIRVGDTITLKEGDKHVVKSIDKVFFDTECILIFFHDENGLAKVDGYKIVEKKG